MPNPAVYTDVADRWRPLSADEQTVATTLLADAWRMLKRHASKRNLDLETLIGSDADLAAEVVRVEATAVLRVMKNPDGKTQESIDDYSYMRNADAAGGVLYFTEAELDSLFPGLVEKGQAYTIDPLADYAERWT